jgi:hypothetical protein
MFATLLHFRSLLPLSQILLLLGHVRLLRQLCLRSGLRRLLREHGRGPVDSLSVKGWEAVSL